MIKTVNSKMITNSQLSTTRPKTKRKTTQPEQTTGTGTESQKWRSHGGLSVRKMGDGGKDTGKKTYNW